MMSRTQASWSSVLSGRVWVNLARSSIDSGTTDSEEDDTCSVGMPTPTAVREVAADTIDGVGVALT